MIPYKKRTALVLLSMSLLGLWPQSTARAQNITASASIDSMQIFIGGQINLTLEVSHPQGMAVTFPIYADTLAQSIEVVNRGKIDTLSIENSRIQLRQVYRITSFDSGMHLIPAIRFMAQGDSSQFVQTREMALKVYNPFEEVDPEKGIFDIKQPINTPFSWTELIQYWPYAAGFLGLMLLVALFLVWKYNRKLLTPILGKEKPIDPPHVIALRELERIKEEKLWQKGQEKRYYSDITDVLRHYIETRFTLPALEQTTDEIIQSLRPIESVDNTSLTNLQMLLQTSDLVKFAKHIPLGDENDLSMIHAVFFVNQTKLEIVKTIEEQKETSQKI
ncbi:hypothetical protein LX69_02427 [Breznakibacter xylanolyticus]|uniref:Oxygen tolerance protein BatD n=1 Tax=Breznakibacter xylanolyticus TaxID=990 RepID=A0A2W7NCF3_9BACT|nr:hypothetical protein [Breznakibacter xylanolyticus]PZX14414.1 hypothetical protein LX69_02427 [Breznakibacter xylanolyticus]